MSEQETMELSADVIAQAKKLVAKREAALEKTRENLEKYPHAKPETLKFDEVAKKYSVEIECAECGETERVYTSDLFQVQHCKNCRAEAKKAKMAAKRETLKKAAEAIAKGLVKLD